MKKTLLLALVLTAIFAVVGFAACSQKGRGDENGAALSLLGLLQPSLVFDSATSSRLKKLSRVGEKNPRLVTDDDLRWVTSLIKGKVITGRLEQSAFQECARVLILRYDLPPDLRDAYKDIGSKMVSYRGDAKEHNMVALTGCVLLSRTKDPAVIPLIKPLLSDPDPDYRQRVQRAINELSK